MPIAEAVVMGAVDSMENLFVNVSSRLLPRFGAQRQPPQSLSGQVRAVAYK